MRFIYLLTFLLIANYNFSQSYNWASSAGGNLDDEGTSICADSKGNYFVCGSFSSASISFGEFTLTNKSLRKSSDMFVVKYDASGKILWAVSASGDADERPNSICCDLKGNCYVTGYTESKSMFFDKEELKKQDTASSDPGIFITKYDSDGKLIIKLLGSGESINLGNSICADANENFYITGSSLGDVKFGSYTLKAPYFGVIIIKFDKSGKVVWGKSAGGSEDNQGKSICVDNKGNCYVTGIFKSTSITFGTIKLKNYTTNTGDLFVVKLDSLGKILWATSAGGINDDPGNGICVDSNGDVYIIGTFLSHEFVIGKDSLFRTAYSDDVYIAKFNNKGDPIWGKSFKNSGQDEGKGICLDKKGNILVTGFCRGGKLDLGEVKLENENKFGTTNDIFIATVDKTGKTISAAKTNDSNNIWSNAICLDSNQNILVTGKFTSENISIGTTKLLNNDPKGKSEDVFILKLK